MTISTALKKLSALNVTGCRCLDYIPWPASAWTLQFIALLRSSAAGKVLGANTGDLIAPIVYAMCFGLTVKLLGAAILPSPTMSGSGASLAAAAAQRAVLTHNARSECPINSVTACCLPPDLSFTIWRFFCVRPGYVVQTLTAPFTQCLQILQPCADSHRREMRLSCLKAGLPVQ